MNEKEVSEIRRRFKQDKSNITHIRGCYVNEEKRIVAEFNQSLGLMYVHEAEKFLGILKKTLSGALGRNLLDISFPTQGITDNEAHKLLMRMKTSELKDEEAVQAFFQKVIDASALEGNYLILLANDAYDVPFRAKDGLEMEDTSEEMYSYFLCSICPVKQLKPALSYYIHENEFHGRSADWVVSPPELGFIFPAFDDRRTNIYNALYYTKDIAENHESFVDAIFASSIPMPAAVQKETFETILSEALEQDCRMEVVQAVQDELCEMIQEHKEAKRPEDLVIDKSAVKTVLESCGVPETRAAAFEQRFEEAFGEDAPVRPQNLVSTKQMVVKTPDVTIQVNPEHSGLLETRVIDGKKFILIRADENVVVNGVAIQID